MIRAPCRLRSGLVQLLLRELLHRDLRRQRHQLGGLRPKVLELCRVCRRLGLVLLFQLLSLVLILAASIVILPPEIVLILFVLAGCRAALLQRPCLRGHRLYQQAR